MREDLLRLSLKISGRDVFQEYKMLKELEYRELDKNLELQQKKLREIICFSWKNVPYYKRLLEDSGAINNGKVNISNFGKIPILTKEILRTNLKQLFSKDRLARQRKTYFETSGGSTGEPVLFIHDNITWRKLMAIKWLYYSFITDFPCKFLLLWGDERTILKNTGSLTKQLKNWIYNRKFLNSFKMSDKIIRDYIKIINNYKPFIIESYVQSIYELSKYIKEKNIWVISPMGIITSAGTLYSAMKEDIGYSFRCKIFNRYGSREVGDMACNCDKEEGLHLNIFSHYFEILDKNLKPCKPGEIGKIYITTLDNFSMPLIRYEIGDLAIPSDLKTCSCGRGLPLIANVVGRDVNLFKNIKGELIDGEFFTHLLYMKKWIKKFQIIQKAYEYIEITCVLSGEVNKKDTCEVEDGIKKVLGKKCKITWRFRSEIPELKSGKFLYTISEVKQ